MNRYISDIPYVHSAHPELSPVWIKAVLASLGRPFPSLDGLRVCEIASGTGLSAAITAATLPSARVTALDVLPAHVEHLRSLAEDAELANLAAHEADIAAPPATLDGERFDLILAHGALAWVSPGIREAIFRFIAERLAPGGVAYLHYAAHPGAAVLGSLHKALSLCGREGQRTDERVEEGLALVRQMRQGAGLFAAHPKAASSFDGLASRPRAFVAHEFGNPDWTPLHSADVIARMEEMGCVFAGSATPIQNIDALSLPGGTLETVRKAGSPALAETLKDIARDEAMRQDLYLRGGRPMDARAHLEALRGLTFRPMPGAPRRGPIGLDTRIGPVEGAAAVFDPLLARLHAGPASFGDLEALEPFARRPALLNQSLAMLMTCHAVHPLGPGGADAQEASARLNAVLDRRQAARVHYPARALAAIGGPVPVL